MSGYMVYCLLYKQKTAYEMRISDWSSDGCSSDRDQRSAAEAEEGQKEARRREGDREAEDDLDEPPEAARRLAERQRQTGDDDDDHRDDLRDRPLHGVEHLLERLFPRHPGAGGMGLAGDHDAESDGSAGQKRGTAIGYSEGRDRKSTRLKYSHYSATHMPI